MCGVVSEDEVRMRELSPKSRVRLDNTKCAYCHKPFSKELPAEDEHVIGRRFVPKGSLAAQWNLIVRSCRPCNERKCSLENEVSAITMRPGPVGREPADQRRIAEANRKATARSTRTGNSVGESNEDVQIQGNLMPSVQFSANFVSGPQLDTKRSADLAYLQVSALFYLITYDEEARIGSPIPLGFAPINDAMWPDWGNARFRGFQELISSWTWRVHAVGADGYFKAIIRRHPDESIALWAWALEWNRGYRTVGFFGDRDATQAEFNRLPPLKKMLIERGVDPDKGPFMTYAREEEPLAPADDMLFNNPF